MYASVVVNNVPNPLIPPRHSGRGFVGMADGHVEGFDPAELTNHMRGPSITYQNSVFPPQYIYYFLLPH